MQPQVKAVAKDPADRRGISGLRVFDGEDLCTFRGPSLIVDSGDRKLMQEVQMKDWLTQQLEEKEMQKSIVQGTTK